MQLILGLCVSNMGIYKSQELLPPPLAKRKTKQTSEACYKKPFVFDDTIHLCLLTFVSFLSGACACLKVYVLFMF